MDGEGVGADDAALLGEGAQRVVRLVAHVVEEGARVGVGEGHGTVGGLDRVHRRAVAHVGQVDQDAQAVHLPDGVEAEVAQAVVGALEAPVAQQVALVVRDLDDPDAERVEDRQPVEVVADGRRVLPAEDNGRLALRLRAPNVLDGPGLRQQVGVLAEPAEPRRDVVQRLLVALPHRDRRVDRRHAAGVEAVVDGGAVPAAYVQAVDYDRVAVDLFGRRPRTQRRSSRGNLSCLVRQPHAPLDTRR